jgi:transcriptional regulator with XRE-family HTH domain
MELALRAEISTRHLSYVETGKAKPSRSVLLNLASHLDIPLRDCNRLLLAGGFAPRYAEGTIDEERLEIARAVVTSVLRGHEPNPAFALDRRWNVIDANGAARELFAGIDAALLVAPVNVARAALHPFGLSPMIINLGTCRAHLLRRIQRELAASGDPALHELLSELLSYRYSVPLEDEEPNEIALPLRLRTSQGGERAYLSTVTTFGTPYDVALEELVIEAFYPM